MLKTIKIVLILVLVINEVFAAKSSQPETPPTLVTVVIAKAMEWQPKIAATGTLVAEQGITIKADIPGRITQIFFESGKTVKKGEPLIQIYPDILQAQLKALESKLKLTQLSLTRFTDLYKKQAVSASDFDKAAADFNQAQAAVEESKARLTQLLVTAPFGGILGIRKVSLGDYVSPGQELVNLEDIDPIFVDFSIPEVFSKRVAVGQEVTLSSPAYGKRVFSGKLKAVESLINPNTRTLDIRAEMPNKDHYLIPGSFVEVQLLVGQKTKVISLPQTAIVYSESGPFVFKIVNNKAIKTPVKLGMRGDVNINIDSGLQDGDQVIVTGQQKLFNGAPVEVVKN